MGALNIRYPNVSVTLDDGNAFAVMAATDRALRRAGIPQKERDAYKREAMAGDYYHLLQVTMNWVNVDAYDDWDDDDED